MISVYQMIPLSSHSKCRFNPTCSNYGIEAISRFGAFKGSILTIKRILRCNPWSLGGIDPVPEKFDLFYYKKNKYTESNNYTDSNF